MPSPVAGSALLALAVAAAHPVPPLSGAVRILPLQPVMPGASGELSVTILDTPMAGTPIELRLDDGSGVALADNRLGWSDVVDPQAVQPRLRARFTAPEEPGSYEVLGHLTYVTCTKKRCVRRAAGVRWEVVVEESGGTEGASP